MTLKQNLNLKLLANYSAKASWDHFQPVRYRVGDEPENIDIRHAANTAFCVGSLMNWRCVRFMTCTYYTWQGGNISTAIALNK